jgi:uncharacterized protein (TIGR01244 family)
MALKLEGLGIPNARAVGETWVSAGQPDQAGLENAKAAGVQAVINLRPAAEDPSFDTGAAARALGLSYVELPVTGAGDFTLATVKRFDQLLRETGDTPTLIHCASGNRVGALMALRARWLEHRSAEEAMAIGAASGLTRMAAAVEPLLQRQPI